MCIVVVRTVGCLSEGEKEGAEGGVIGGMIYCLPVAQDNRRDATH